MTPDAHVISTRYTKSVIKSCAALSYVEAQARMDDRCMNSLLVICLDHSHQIIFFFDTLMFCVLVYSLIYHMHVDYISYLFLSS